MHDMHTRGEIMGGMNNSTSVVLEEQGIIASVDMLSAY